MWKRLHSFMTLTPLKPTFPPSLHSCDILYSVWPTPAEYSVCASHNYALFASHHNKHATRLSYTGTYNRVFKILSSCLSQPCGTAAELNTMGSNRLHSQDYAVKKGKININFWPFLTIFLNTLKWNGSVLLKLKNKEFAGTVLSGTFQICIPPYSAKLNIERNRKSKLQNRHVPWKCKL